MTFSSDAYFGFDWGHGLFHLMHTYVGLDWGHDFFILMIRLGA